VTTPRLPSGPEAPQALLYLHGFRSSPLSFKAQRVGRWLAEHQPQVAHWCPQLPASPRQAVADVEAGLAARWPALHNKLAQALCIVGSSLGGFYATVLAERLGCRSAVLNPAVFPARDLARHIGEHPAWHDPAERVFFRPEHIAELQTLMPTPTAPLAHPERYVALIARGDEVLDWRERCATSTATCRG
jgi:uncharacterized protein